MQSRVCRDYDFKLKVCISEGASHLGDGITGTGVDGATGVTGDVLC